MHCMLVSKYLMYPVNIWGTHKNVFKKQPIADWPLRGEVLVQKPFLTLATSKVASQPCCCRKWFDVGRCGRGPDSGVWEAPSGPGTWGLKTSKGPSTLTATGLGCSILICEGGWTTGFLSFPATDTAPRRPGAAVSKVSQHLSRGPTELSCRHVSPARLRPAELHLLPGAPRGNPSVRAHQHLPNPHSTPWVGGRFSPLPTFDGKGDFLSREGTLR